MLILGDNPHGAIQNLHVLQSPLVHIVIRADEGLIDSLDCVVATQDTTGVQWLVKFFKRD